MLDAKNKASAKTQALSSNPALAGQVIQNLEDSLNELRKDHDELKGKYDREMKQTLSELDGKADKSQLADLEARLLQQL